MLVGGKRVAKDSLRVEAYGAVDELNSVVGLARVFNEEDRESGEGHRFLDEVLCQIQDELFDIGSELATPPEFFQTGMYRVSADEIRRLERRIDQCQKDLEPLQSFILPGGGRIGAYLHQCRTVCRRVERDVLRLSREEMINDDVVKYLNRLSDFFVLARWISHQMGEPEIYGSADCVVRAKEKSKSKRKAEEALVILDFGFWIEEGKVDGTGFGIQSGILVP